MTTRLLISACLLGLTTSYHGRPDPAWNQGWAELITKALEAGLEFIPVCPEQLGGLSTPRPPAELQDAAAAILSGTGKITTNQGADVTAEFLLGSQQTLLIAQRLSVSGGIMKSRSPSCGFGKVHSGRFDGTFIDGDGITSRQLADAGFKIWESNDFFERWKELSGFQFIKHR